MSILLSASVLEEWTCLAKPCNDQCQCGYSHLHFSGLVKDSPDDTCVVTTQVLTASLFGDTIVFMTRNNPYILNGIDKEYLRWLNTGYSDEDDIFEDTEIVADIRKDLEPLTEEEVVKTILQRVMEARDSRALPDTPKPQPEGSVL